MSTDEYTFWICWKTNVGIKVGLKEEDYDICFGFRKLQGSDVCKKMHLEFTEKAYLDINFEFEILFGKIAWISVLNTIFCRKITFENHAYHFETGTQSRRNEMHSFDFIYELGYKYVSSRENKLKILDICFAKS